MQADEVKPQYVFTITDGGFAKRTRINDYRLTNRGGLGVKAMGLVNEDRGGLVGAFIVEEGDEVLSITASGQVVRSPVNEEFRPTGRSTMGVKFVTPKKNDSVAVVARSVEAKVDAEDGVERAPRGRQDGRGGCRPRMQQSMPTKRPRRWSTAPRTWPTTPRVRADD